MVASFSNPFRPGAGHKPPHLAGRVEETTVFKALLDQGKLKHFYDVRTEKERQQSKIEGIGQLDDKTLAEVEELPKDTPLAFHCHHGGRSRAAAEHFLKLGFRNVYTLAGGIDAWSRDIDPKVPRY